VKPIRLQRKETFNRVFIVLHAGNYILLDIYIVNDNQAGCPRLIKERSPPYRRLSHSICRHGTNGKTARLDYCLPPRHPGYTEHAKSASSHRCPLDGIS
jgi:hypothetical protein